MKAAAVGAVVECAQTAVRQLLFAVRRRAGIETCAGLQYKLLAVAQHHAVARRAVLMRDPDAAGFVGQALLDFGVTLVQRVWHQRIWPALRMG